MPKVTFYNLTEEKQQKLIGAAQEEFSACPFSNASIANIVKSAGIPRGSFYQYFKDKEDLYLFLLNGLAEKRKAEFARILQQNNGELFQSLSEFYISVLQKVDMPEFTKNIFLNMTEKTEMAFSKIMADKETGESFEEMKSLVDRTKLNIQNDHEFYHLLKILFAVTMRNWVERFAKDLSWKESAANFELELKLLKNGLMKN